MDGHDENSNGRQQQGPPLDASKEQFRAFSTQLSVVSTKDLIDSDKAKEVYFKKMSCKGSRKAFMAIICLLSIGILATTSLLIIQYKGKMKNTKEKSQNSVSRLL